MSKHIVSVSLGSSGRNATGSIELCGETYEISREGHDGDIAAMRARLCELDGAVDAIGMGGCSCYLYGKNGRKYPLKAICRLATVVKQTPFVDGAAVKETLERRVVASMEKWGLPLKGQKVLMVCGLERLGMAEALEACGAQLRFGDMMFALGFGGAIKKLKTLHRLIAMLAPIVTILPFKALYPSGSGQNKRDKRYGRHYAWADVIAGDYLYINAHLPDSLEGKVIVTNTVTPADVLELKQRGVRALITTAPEIEGRSYGTNVIEALLVAMSGVKGRALSEEEYAEQIDRAGLEPRVEFFRN